ncbi:MAG: carboxypeptidase-like regulatory domain-containing protein [Pyrinomonadaceae bacterium MAG19_C2-C3]|nr:carboxypeptidase-like regulatory domain-containing protein [Pyrinomonadaceae bacterium MAG19_C2-C3]
MKKTATIFALTAFALFASASVHAQNFGAGNIVVYRVGDGTSALANTATSVFLDEYTQSGTLVRSIPLPSATPDPATITPTTNRALTADGTGNFEGQITRSVDGRFVTLTGYNRTAGPGRDSTADTAGTTNRIVGTVDAAGNINTTAVIDNAFGTNQSIRSAVTTGGTAGNLSFYVVGSNNGVRLATQGTMTSLLASTVVTPTTAPQNIRVINIFGGQLFVSAASTAATAPLRAGAVGSGIPPADGTQPITNLPGIPDANNQPFAPVGFFFADLDPSVNFTINGFTTPVDTLYITDEGRVAAPTIPAAILKFTFNGTTFVQTGSVALPRARGLTGFVTNSGSVSTVTLFAVNVPVAAGASAVQMLTDTSDYNGTFNGTPTQIASSPTNTAFRGVALAPLVNPTADEVLIEGRVTNARGVPIGGVTLRLSGSRQAVTRTNDDGFYRFEGVEVGGLYTVTAVSRGFSFSPRTLTFGDVQTNTVADFTATPPSKGRRSRFSR